MGVSSKDLAVLIELKANGYLSKPLSVIEIGAQQLSNSLLTEKEKLEKIGHLFGASLPHPFPDAIPSHIFHDALEHQNANAPRARDFWEWLGFKYASIDIDESPSTIPLDLNYDDVPSNAQGKYQLVTNSGTTEHIANQLNAFKIIHELTAVGGIMYHNLPSQGALNHGLITYNPKFFWMLARSNGYKWLYADYTSDLSYYNLPQNIIDYMLPFNPNINELKEYQVADCSVVVALQKMYNTPFVPPLDIESGTKTNNKVLEERYWSIYKEDVFEHLPRYGQSKFSILKKRIRRLIYGK